jgi:hypothetical protein
MTASKHKQFDCLKMKDTIQARIYSETRNMSTQALLDYFNKEPIQSASSTPAHATLAPRLMA